MKPYIIFVEGPDRAGKSSIVIPLHKASGRLHDVFHRGPMSCMVYNRLYGRDIPESGYLENLTSLPRCVIIYLIAEPTTLIDRAIKTGETDIPLEDYELHVQAFEDMYKNLCSLGINICRITTDFKTPDRIIDIALEYINLIDRKERYAD